MVPPNPNVEALKNFLGSDIVQLPKDRTKHKDQSFPEYLSYIFNNYYSALSAASISFSPIVDVQSKLSFVQDQINMLLEVIDFYYHGQSAKAFSRLSEWLKINYDLYKELIASKPVSIFGDFHLYRIRLGDPGTSYTHKDLFHIPFELRHGISTQRYSMSGYPSLYASSSLYLCWKEMNCPSFDRVYAIRIIPDSSQIHLLDFGITPRFIVTFLNSKEKEGFDFSKSTPETKKLFDDIAARILTWPIQAASMVRVLYQKEPFVPEYIVPQLILQFITDSKSILQTAIDGIRYFSTKYDQLVDSPTLGCNYVFPVKESSPIGHCPILAKLFKSTLVLPWQLATAGSFDKMSRDLGGWEEFELIKGKTISYKSTYFFELEMILEGMRADNLF